MFVSPFSEKPLSSGRVGVKQVGHEAGCSQAFQGAGPLLSASSQLQLLPERGGVAPSTQTPPPRPVYPSEKKRGVSIQQAPGFRVWLKQSLEHGQFRACLIALVWAGSPPLAKSLSISQRLAMAHLRTEDQAIFPNTCSPYLAIPIGILCTLGGELCQSPHSTVLTSGWDRSPLKQPCTFAILPHTCWWHQPAQAQVCRA